MIILKIKLSYFTKLILSLFTNTSPRYTKEGIKVIYDYIENNELEYTVDEVLSKFYEYKNLEQYNRDLSIPKKSIKDIPDLISEDPIVVFYRYD